MQTSIPGMNPTVEGSSRSPSGAANFYRAIYLDPPWLERGGGKSKRGADRHYPLLTTQQIIEVVIRCPVWHPDRAGCHLWMWVTNNFLRDGFKVMDALGFRYVTNAVWCKDKMGLGQYLRGKHELLLFGVCGKMTSSSRSTSSVIGDGPLPRRRHSQKPDETYDIIEAVSQGPYLEIFALQEREGWDCWGNDIYEP